MQDAYDFRLIAHKLLLAVDASTTEMMMMVANSSMGSVEWRAAVLIQQTSFADLHAHLGLPEACELMQGNRYH
ncbi:hypothetical protein ACCD10_32250 [Pseudomonas sp. Pseusp122]|uniref:hypothetical protein n=1 Tax=unclassified Pseudomonas TaxID=196821 RepID=UPI0039A48501